jgi:hypothetical protein
MAAVRPPAQEAPVVVALGASNLSRGMPRLISAVRSRVAGPTMLTAAGHGRSYGANSRVAWRRLPSILRSGLWRAVDRLGPSLGDRRLVALVTDIGNDLLYGFSVDQTAGWVRECLSRLVDRTGHVTVTALPLASVARAGPVRYRLLRTIYVPGCRLPLADLQQAAGDLDAAVRELAAEFGAEVIEQPGDWYGIDSIHVRRRRLNPLWERVCMAWNLPEPKAPAGTSIADWMRVGRQPAEVRSLVNRMLFTPQPVVQWPDGTTLSLY